MKTKIVATIAMLAVALVAGAQSPTLEELQSTVKDMQNIITNLQQQYNDAHKQYVNDCVAPMTSGAGDALSGRTPPPISKEQEDAQKKKCDQEAKRAGDLQNELQQASK